MEKEILTTLNELKSSGVQVSYWVYIWIAVISLIFSGLGAYLSSYLRKKGEQTATKEDIEEIKNQLKQTTETIETVKASVSKNLYIEKSKWDFKKDIYYDLLVNLDELRYQTRQFKGHVKTSPKSSLEKTNFKSLIKTFRTVLQYEDIGGLFVDQSIMDEVSILRDVFSKTNQSKEIPETIWDDLIDVINDLIKNLRSQAKKDLFG